MSTCPIKLMTTCVTGLSTEVAELITSTYKNIVGIGTDVSSVDPGATPDFAVHKQFSKAGLYNIENVNFEKKVPGAFLFIALISLL